MEDYFFDDLKDGGGWDGRGGGESVVGATLFDGVEEGLGL